MFFSNSCRGEFIAGPDAVAVGGSTLNGDFCELLKFCNGLLKHLRKTEMQHGHE